METISLRQVIGNITRRSYYPYYWWKLVVGRYLVVASLLDANKYGYESTSDLSTILTSVV